MGRASAAVSGTQQPHSTMHLRLDRHRLWTREEAGGEKEKERKKEREDECMLLKLACVVLMPALQAELRYKNESILDKFPHFHV